MMKFKIRETGNIEELSYVDTDTGVDCINDVIGQACDFDGYSEYDEELDLYHIGQDDFEWWKNHIDNLEKYDNAFKKFEEDLGKRYDFDDYIFILEKFHISASDGDIENAPLLGLREIEKFRREYIKYFDEDEIFDWTLLSEELYAWADDLTDFTEWDWVDGDRKAQLSEEALKEVEAILAEIK